MSRVAKWSDGTEEARKGKTSRMVKWRIWTRSGGGKIQKEVMGRVVRYNALEDKREGCNEGI